VPVCPSLVLRAAAVSKSLFFSFILSFSSLRRRSLPDGDYHV
jgi:hypothetical protein